MSDWNGFGGLDLTSVQTGGGNTRLQPGRYIVVCKDAKVEEIRNTKNRKLVCDFQAEDGSGEIRFNFNIHHTSEQAQDIGKRQLKSFLVAAGHSNPDKPGDVASLKALKCAVIVGMGKPWRDENNVERQNTEIKSFLKIDGASASAGGGGKGFESLEDDIPF